MPTKWATSNKPYHSLMLQACLWRFLTGYEQSLWKSMIEHGDIVLVETEASCDTHLTYEPLNAI